VVCLFLVLFLGGDVLAWPLMHWANGPVFAGGLLGACAGQLGLLAAWGVVGPGKLLVRWLQALLAAVVFYCAVATGMTTTVAFDGPYLVASLLLLPMLLLAVQVPLWIFHGFTGCRIVPDSQDNPALPEGSRQFRLVDLFAGTMAVAVTLGLAKTAISLDVSARTGGSEELERFVMLGVVCGVMALWSLFTTLPCLYATLAARDLHAGLTFILFYGGAITCVAAIILVVAVSGGPGGAGEMLSFWIFLNGTAFAVLVVPLAVMRKSGHVLLRPGRTRLGPQPDAASPFAETGEGQESGG